jgi:hypothetical protein
VDELDALRSLGEQLSPPAPTREEIARARRQLDRLIVLAHHRLEVAERSRPLPGHEPWRRPGDELGGPGRGRGIGR